ncbi:MAG: hypothetical protein QF415_07270 [Candidatus Undinarchaeales archaeon]|jgi:hypothetical protein|nr:hypothetical protein [Candidatus Undinarchaeales archaeon]MDP7493808.1 hypothetical protein [Candidatus Undinarchaeales archaeon]
MTDASCDECGIQTDDIAVMSVELPTGVRDIQVCKTCFMAYAMTHALMNFDDAPISV